MSEEQYQIRREEWDEMRATLGRIDKAVTQFLEREKASEGRVNSVEAKADKALELAQNVNNRVIALEANSGNNSRKLDSWQDLGVKIIGGGALIFIGGVATKFMGL